MEIKITFLSLCIALLVSPFSVQGRELFVSVSSSVTGECGADWQNACSSIIQALTRSTSGDIITVGDGTYKGTENTDLDFKGLANIVLRSSNGASKTTIDLESRVDKPFVASAKEGIQNVTITGFTVKNGLSNENGGALSLAVNHTKVRLEQMIFTSNTANKRGGAITLLGMDSVLVIRNCTFSKNTAKQLGGAIHAELGATILFESDGRTTTQFEDNKSNQDGGALHIMSRSNIYGHHVVFVRNKSYRNGACGYAFESRVEFHHSSFSDNEAQFGDCGCFFLGRTIFNTTYSQYYNNSCPGNGGAFAVEGTGAGLHTFQSLLTNNRARYGGAVELNDNARLFVRESNITGNTGSRGGAIRLQSEAVAILTDSLLTDNTGNDGGAVYLSDTSSMTLIKSKVVANTAKGGGAGIFCSNSKVNITNSAVQDNKGPNYDADSNTPSSGSPSTDFFCSASPSLTYCRVSGDANWDQFCQEAVAPPDNQPSSKALLAMVIAFPVVGCLLCVGCMVLFYFKTKNNNKAPLGIGAFAFLKNQDEEDDELFESEMGAVERSNNKNKKKNSNNNDFDDDDEQDKPSHTIGGESDEEENV